MLTRAAAIPARGRSDRAVTPHVSMFWYNLAGTWHVLRHRRSLGTHDIINGHFSIPSGPLAWFASRLLRRPNVLTIIGGDIYDPSKKLSPHRIGVFRVLNRWLIRTANEVIAISSDTENRAREYYSIDRPISVINYGFNPPEPTLSAAERMAGAFEGFTLIGVGRLIERKGFRYAVDALSELPRDVRLVLVGDGPLESELKDQAAKLGVADRLTITGYLTREELAGCLRRSDCFVLSSLHEGLGIVVQEAMDAGLPVVATNHGGQVDLIREPRNGVLVDPEDSGALARAVLRLYRDRTLAREMGEHNREDIALLNIAANAEDYISIFGRLVPADGAVASAVSA